MNRFTKRVLILTVFVLCLFGLTILGASAATYDDDAAATTAGAVARIGDEGNTATYYDTFAAAVTDAVTNGGTVTILKDIDLGATLSTITMDKGTTLTIQGKDLGEGRYPTITESSDTRLFNVKHNGSVGTNLTFSNINWVTNGNFVQIDSGAYNVTVNVTGKTTITASALTNPNIFLVYNTGRLNIGSDAVITASGAGTKSPHLINFAGGWKGIANIDGTITSSAYATGTDWNTIIRLDTNGDAVLNIGATAVLTYNVPADVEPALNTGMAGIIGTNGGNSSTIFIDPAAKLTSTYDVIDQDAGTVGLMASKTYTSDAEALADGMVVRLGAEGSTGIYANNPIALITYALKNSYTSIEITVVGDYTHKNSITITTAIPVTIQGKDLGEGKYPTITESAAFVMIAKAGVNLTVKNLTFLTTGALFRTDGDGSVLLMDNVKVYGTATMSGDGIIDCWKTGTLTVKENVVIDTKGVAAGAQVQIFVFNDSFNGTADIYCTVVLDVTGKYNHKIIRNCADQAAGKINVYAPANFTYSTTKNSWESAMFYSYDNKGTIATIHGGTFVVNGNGNMFAGHGAAAGHWTVAGGTFTHNGGDATDNYMFYRHGGSELLFKVQGDDIKLTVKGTTTLVEQGYGMDTVKGAYISSASTKLVASEGEYFSMLGVKFDSEAIAKSVTATVSTGTTFTLVGAMYADGAKGYCFVGSKGEAFDITAQEGYVYKVVAADGFTTYAASLADAINIAAEGDKVYDEGATDVSTSTAVKLNGANFTVYSGAAVNVGDIVTIVAVYNENNYSNLALADAAALADGKKVRVGDNMPTYYNNVAEAFAAATTGATIYALDGSGNVITLTVADKTVTYNGAAGVTADALYAELGMVARVDDAYFATLAEAVAAANGKTVYLLKNFSIDSAIALDGTTVTITSVDANNPVTLTLSGTTFHFELSNGAVLNLADVTVSSNGRVAMVTGSATINLNAGATVTGPMLNGSQRIYVNASAALTLNINTGATLAISAGSTSDNAALIYVDGSAALTYVQSGALTVTSSFANLYVVRDMSGNEEGVSSYTVNEGAVISLTAPGGTAFDTVDLVDVDDAAVTMSGGIHSGNCTFITIQDDADALDQGYIVRAGEVADKKYFKNLKDAFAYAATVDETVTLYIITDIAITEEIDVPAGAVIVLSSAEKTDGGYYTLTKTGDVWMFDIPAGAEITLANINVLVGEKLAYVGGVLSVADGAVITANATAKNNVFDIVGTMNVTGGTINFNNQTNNPFRVSDAAAVLNISGGTITNQSESGMVYAAAGTVNISGGTLLEKSAANMFQSNTVITVTGGTLTHSGNGAAIFYGQVNVTVSGNAVITKGGDGTGYIYQRQSGGQSGFLVDGADVQLIVTGDNYITYGGYTNANGGSTTIKNATISVGRADGAICYHEAHYLALVNVKVATGTDAAKVVGYVSNGTGALPVLAVKMDKTVDAYSSFKGATAAVEANGTIYLWTDLTVTGGPFMLAPNAYTIDGDGFVITHRGGDLFKDEEKEGSDVTIKNLTIDSVGGGVVFYLYSTVTLEDIDLVVTGFAKGHVIYTRRATTVLNIKGGNYYVNIDEYDGTNKYNLMRHDVGVVNIEDANFVIDGIFNDAFRFAAEANISGGHFTMNDDNGLVYGPGAKLTITGGIFETNYPAIKAGTYLIYNAGADGFCKVYGGEFYLRNGAAAAIYAGDAGHLVEIYGGYIEANGESVLLVNGGATLNVYGGTVVLQPSHKGIGGNSAYAVIRCSRDNGTSFVNIYGGMFINNNDAEPISANGYSNAVIFKNSSASSVRITGGTFLATGFQDYYYKSVGNTGGATSIPLNDIPVVKKSVLKVMWGGREFYSLTFSNGVVVAPEATADVQIRLVENSTGIMFTSKLSSALYAALLTWFENAPEGSTLAFGTVIAPVNRIAEAGAFTMEAFEAADLVYLNIPATSTGMKVDEDGNLVIRAAMVNIRDGYYDTVFTAVPYAKIITPDTEDEDPMYYGAFNTNKAAASMSYLAELALADNVVAREGEYQYKSLTVNKAYNRYTRAQQETLMSFLSHEHAPDFKGYCAECETSFATTLTESNAVKLYSEYESVYHYTLEMTAGVDYRIALSKKLGIFKLYNADGDLCTITDDIVKCTETGTYYLVFYASRIGSGDLTFDHIHKADYKGLCAVCENSFLVEVPVDDLYSTQIIKGNQYYYMTEMTAGVQYLVMAVNATYEIYDAQGNNCTPEDSYFNCTETGEYYIVTTATISALATFKVEHVHAFNHKGECGVAGCGETVLQSFPGIFKEMGNALSVPSVKGSVLYYSVEFEADKVYTLTVNNIASIYTIYDEAGVRIALDDNDSFTCTADGTYYLVVQVQSTATAEIYFSYAHDCVHNHKGICTICGVTSNIQVSQGSTQDVLVDAEKYVYYKVAGPYLAATYKLTLPEGVASFELVQSDGTVITVTDGIFVYADAYSGNLYLKLVAGEEGIDGTFKLQHVHAYDYKGDCTIGDCTDRVRERMGAGDVQDVTYTAGETHYYQLYLDAATEYTVTLTNVNATWTLYDAQGTVLATTGNYTTTTDGYYYLVVVATADTAENASISVAPVVQGE